jgi:4-amino-4-deoxy-L-arabinose transferase-like glycosyltransferase
VLIILTLAVCYFSRLGVIGFVGPDEPRYAWIARDMTETGDWVTPRLYGKPWFEKPPLYYWSAAVSFKFFGVSEKAARLPSAVAALLATLALAWLALRLYGAQTARWLLLLLPTSVGMIGFSHAASTDMIFSATLTLALVAACVLLRLVPGLHSEIVIPGGDPQSSAARSRRTPAGLLQRANRGIATQLLPLVLFGFFLGLAVLAKGPAAVILLGGAIFFWALFTKRWRDAFRLFHPAAFAAFLLTALPWYALCAERNPDFFRIFIIEHNFKRYLTPEFQHIQPFWYYAAVLPVAFLPWTALLLGSLITASVRQARIRCISKATCLLLCWSAFCVLFFTISKSKLPGYILPAIPASAILLVPCNESVRKTKALLLSALTAAFLFALACLFAGYAAWQIRAPNGAGVAARWIFVAFLAANLLLGSGLSLPLKNRSCSLLAPCAALPILLAVLFSDRLIPAFFIGDPSGRTIAQELKKMNVPSGQVATHHMERAKRYSLSFYLHQEIPEWDSLHPVEAYVLEQNKIVSLVYNRELVIDPQPRKVADTGYFLYDIKRRSVGAARGGETK